MRKNFKNLQSTNQICDHKQRIRYVNARHPGASHDSHVWNASEAADYIKRNYLNGDTNTRLLGKYLFLNVGLSVILNFSR